MGATNVTRTYKFSTPRDEIEKNFNAQVDTSLYEDGHSYSGAIGMFGHGIARWADLDLADENAADDWLLETHQKWDRAIAVSFRRDGEKWWLIGGWVSE